MPDSPPWATPQDVRDRWLGGTLDATDEQLTTLIGDAEDTILGEFPDLPDRIDADPSVDGAIPLLRVKKVVARVVMRHVRNPSGERSRMEVSGPFTQNVMFGGDAPGSLYLTDEDRAELAGNRASGGGAFTIDQTPTPSTAQHWLDYGGTWA